MVSNNFIKLYESSFKENWSLNALTDLNETTKYTYGDLAKEIARLHVLFEHIGIKKDDKIALIGQNHSSWVIVFMATITYGAVIVPILRDFHPDSIENIILHSDAKISFIDQSFWKNINKERINHPVFTLPSLILIQSKNDYLENLQTIVDENFLFKYPNGFHSEDIMYSHITNESVVCINYISGTKNFIRGAMLTGKNFAGNMESIKKLNLIFKGENIVAFLPMAHAFSCTFDLLYGLTIGAYINILNRMRSIEMLLDTFQKVKPKLISTVPLILEKIVVREKEEIINKPSLKFLFKIPLINIFLHIKMKKSLIVKFGGNHREMLVGGATLNKDVEDLLHKINFPFSVGYGMTECAPVISIDKHKEFVPRSCGKVVEATMEARIDSYAPQSIPGEIQLRGDHVMKGYYKNPEATTAIFTEDGWMKTGDLGVLDNNNRLYITGLLKTMILGSNGQNIFQKEIEDRFKEFDYVEECLVIKRNNGLIALIYPDYNKMKDKGVSFLELDKLMKDNRKEVNKMIALYERIDSIEIMKSEFEKTEKKTIKRNMYS
ncbi:MAG: AMP-binding protein [Candidatus Saccharimonadaceae bacterium]